MSYNMRKGGIFNRGQTAPIGQRRSAQLPLNPFVSGGQLNPQSKPLIQMPPRRQQQPQQQQQLQQQDQECVQQIQSRQSVPQQQHKTQQSLLQQQTQTLPQTIQPQVQQQPKLAQQQQINPQTAPAPISNVEGAKLKSETLQQFQTIIQSSDTEISEEFKRPKPAWMKTAGNKISKKERLRRRNQKLRKILQPKNALMVLHELLENTSYNLSESSDTNPYEGTLFKASVNVDGIEHCGSGKNKIAAKTAAAEAAIKYLVFKKLKSSGQTASAIINKIGDDDVNLEECEENNSGSLSWQHVACFALHKLFTLWDDGVSISEKLTGVNVVDGQQQEKKPAKKLPANAQAMNPIMLLNQMLPQVQYEEIERVGFPPNIVFTYKCSIDDQHFVGSGSNKKTAKKLCAYAACSALLQINYPPEVYTSS